MIPDIYSNTRGIEPSASLFPPSSRVLLTIDCILSRSVKRPTFFRGKKIYNHIAVWAMNRKTLRKMRKFFSPCVWWKNRFFVFFFLIFFFLSLSLDSPPLSLLLFLTILHVWGNKERDLSTVNSTTPPHCALFGHFCLILKSIKCRGEWEDGSVIGYYNDRVSSLFLIATLVWLLFALLLF